jgi:hypothetical protein
MSIADVYNVPSDQTDLQRWSFLHMVLHRDQNLSIYRTKNVLLPEFVLDPIDPSPNSQWFQNHQTMHDNVDQELNVPQFNLIDVDWTQDTSRIGWIQAHAQLHQQEAEALEDFS